MSLSGTLRKSLRPKRADFDYLRDHPSTLSAFPLKMYFRPSRIGIPETRLAYSISRKVGNAVRRNRTRRIMRELFRMSSSRRLGMDVLTVVHPGLYIDSRSIDESESMLRRAFLQLIAQLENR